MTFKRIIPCLDVRDGKVVKGVRFENLQEIDEPTILARRYAEAGADELAFYDITASVEKRGLYEETLRAVTTEVSIPLIAGGGIRSLADIERVLACGAKKVSLNTGVIDNPGLIAEAAARYGSGCIVLSVDMKRVGDAYHVFRSGGRVDTGIEGIGWITRCVQDGAGEVVLNAIDTDGVRDGYDIDMLRAVTEAVDAPVIASGGAGSVDDFIRLFQQVPKVDAALAASVFHFGLVDIAVLKQALRNHGIKVRR